MTDSDPKFRVGFMLIPRFNMMSLTTTIEPMRIVNYLLPQPWYEWDYLALDDGEISASNGMRIDCIAAVPNARRYDLIFVFGSWGCERGVDARLCGWLRAQQRRGIPLCAIELGIYALAHAGLVNRKCVTTHWSCSAGFREQFPNIPLSEQLFTIDKNIMSCAGGTAGIDLMLHIIERHHGNHLVSEVTDQILHYPKRPAETVQRHTLGCTTGTIHPDVRAAVQLIQDNVAEPLSVPEIAHAVGISQRQLERHCNHCMGCSIVQLRQILRLQYARTLLVSTRLSILEVAVASGFNSMSHFAQVFRKYFGKKPSGYRQAWPEIADAPSWPGTLFSFINSRKAGQQPKPHAVE